MRAIKLHSALGLVSAIAIVGCGGSAAVSPATTTGRASVAVTWSSATSRLIPAAANSIVVSFRNGTTVVATQTLARPPVGSASTSTFANLPVGPMTLVAQAYPSTSGTGNVQASVSRDVTIVANVTTPFAVTMATTIRSLTLSVPSNQVPAGKTLTIVATAYDASGTAVLTANSAFTFSSSNPASASVDANGVVTALAPGTATITVVETESGVSSTLNVTVTAGTGGAVVTVS